MKKQLIASVGFGLASVTLFAGFPEDFQAAKKLRPEQAAPRFLELAARAPEGAKEQALYLAGLNWIRIRQYAKAEAVVNQLTGSAAKVLELQFLDAQKKRDEILTRYEKEEIGNWSDRDQEAGYWTRGNVFLAKGRYEEAVKDFRCAYSLAPEELQQASILLACGRALTAMKRENEAEKDYRRITEMTNLKGYGVQNQAYIYLAELLSAKKQYAEALAEIAKIKKAPRGYWAYTPLLKEAAILSAMGKTTEAKAKQQEAEQRK